MCFSNLIYIEMFEVSTSILKLLKLKLYGRKNYGLKSTALGIVLCGGDMMSWWRR